MTMLSIVRAVQRRKKRPSHSTGGVVVVFFAVCWLPFFPYFSTRCCCCCCYILFFGRFFLFAHAVVRYEYPFDDIVFPSSLAVSLDSILPTKKIERNEIESFGIVRVSGFSFSCSLRNDMCVFAESPTFFAIFRLSCLSVMLPEEKIHTQKPQKSQVFFLVVFPPDHS